MDVKRAIDNGDASGLRRLLSEDSSRANEVIRWGKCLTHPLHYISDMLYLLRILMLWCNSVHAGNSKPRQAILLLGGAPVASI